MTSESDDERRRQDDRTQRLTVEEGLCRDEEGRGAHPEQRDELQEPEAGDGNQREKSTFVQFRIILN